MLLSLSTMSTPRRPKYNVTFRARTSPGDHLRSDAVTRSTAAPLEQNNNRRTGFNNNINKYGRVRSVRLGVL